MSDFLRARLHPQQRKNRGDGVAGSDGTVYKTGMSFMNSSLRARLRDARSAPRNGGFTLIELSIVLVIIGLIIGGVMMGRDMIEGARIRGVVSQIDKYKSAYQTFRLKYNCIPGDCATASQFGFIGLHYWPGTAANGDGNGLIYSYNDGTTMPNTMPQYAESWASLAHLGGAGLIDKVYNNSMSTSTTNLPIARGFMFFSSMRKDVATAGTTQPDRTGNFMYIGTYPQNGQHFNPIYPLFTVRQAFAFDSKIDDGFPMTGSVRATTTNQYCGRTLNPSPPGPCFNMPVLKSAIGARAAVDDTVSPAVYYFGQTVQSGAEYYGLTDLHMPAD